MFSITRSLAFLAILIGLAVFYSLRSQPPRVISITPATALDDAYRPINATDTFGPEDTFFIAVELKGYRGDAPLVARWYYEDEMITDTPLDAPLQGDIYAGFVLRNDDPPWPTGQYRVEIRIRDQALGDRTFRVVDR